MDELGRNTLAVGTIGQTDSKGQRRMTLASSINDIDVPLILTVSAIVFSVIAALSAGAIVSQIKQLVSEVRDLKEAFRGVEERSQKHDLEIALQHSRISRLEGNHP